MYFTLYVSYEIKQATDV